VTPFKVRAIFPVVAPAGTLAVMLVAVAEVMLATTPLKVTILVAGVGLKPVPVMVMVASTAPLSGLKLVMVGVAKTVKLVELATVAPLTVTEMVPVLAPTGTVVVILVVVDVVTTAVVLLNFTT
jgi:hypothetical protein